MTADETEHHSFVCPIVTTFIEEWKVPLFLHNTCTYTTINTGYNILLKAFSLVPCLWSCGADRSDV